LRCPEPALQLVLGHLLGLVVAAAEQVQLGLLVFLAE
jgi:hypothetical protein